MADLRRARRRLHPQGPARSSAASRAQRARALLVSLFPPAWLAGTTALAVAKVLENMELGHNVMHGQWDWMRDPEIHSTTWEWDNVSSAEGWKKSHNYEHHTYTNIVGKDRDLGYTLLRLDTDQPWKPFHLAQPLYNVVLAAGFQWGVALYDLELDEARKGRKPWRPRRLRRRPARPARPRDRSPRTTSPGRCCPARRRCPRCSAT